MTTPLTNAKIRELKAQAQRMKATIKFGKDGLSEAFLKALKESLEHRELVKVKFEFAKEEKTRLSPLLAAQTGSHLVTRVGNVVVLYKPKEPKPATEESEESSGMAG